MRYIVVAAFFVLLVFNIETLSGEESTTDACGESYPKAFPCLRDAVQIQVLKGLPGITGLTHAFAYLQPLEDIYGKVKADALAENWEIDSESIGKEPDGDKYRVRFLRESRSVFVSVYKSGAATVLIVVEMLGDENSEEGT